MHLNTSYHLRASAGQKLASCITHTIDWAKPVIFAFFLAQPERRPCTLHFEYPATSLLTSCRHLFICMNLIA
jgi:hypothetical protein